MDSKKTSHSASRHSTLPSNGSRRPTPPSGPPQRHAYPEPSATTQYYTRGVHHHGCTLTYQPLTSQALKQHDLNQASQTISAQEMTPTERFEVPSSFPYQRHSTYQPLTHSPYAVVTPHQFTSKYQADPPSSLQPEVSPDGFQNASQQNAVYWAPERDHYGFPTCMQNATERNNDLAAIGTQFYGST